MDINIKNNNVLFLDDEELILEKIKRKLKKTDFNLFFAHSGSEALKMIAEYEIAVLVIDLNISEFTGVEFIKVVSNKYPEISKIVFSIYTDLNIILSVLNHDIFQYIPKSRVNKDHGYQIELIPVIKNALRQYNLLQENRKLKANSK